VIGAALMLLPVACHKEEQAVVGVAQTAVNAEQKAQQAAQAAATERDQQRAALAQIPLPTKSLYANVHDANAWQNPFLTVGTSGVSLRTQNDASQPKAAAPAKEASAKGKHGQTHPATPVAAQPEPQISLNDLAQALATLPGSAWRYGRVIAVAEAPQAPAKERVAIRRNMEQAIQKLNDLGIVVEEWPTK